jgi:starch synthase
VPWGTPIEVFLDPLGRTLDDFCERMTGGWLFGYVEAFALAGWAPTLVLSSRTATTELSRVHTPTGTPVTVLPAPAGRPAPQRPGLRRDVAAYWGALAPGLLRALARHDVVLLQEYEEPRADLLAWWGRLRGTPVVPSFQGGVPPWEAAPVQRLLRGWSLRRLPAILVGPAEEAARLVGERGIDPRRVHRVANPVDTAAWRPSDRAAARARLGVPPDAAVVAWHGRVDLRRKGLDVLAQAWARVCERHSGRTSASCSWGPDRTPRRCGGLSRALACGGSTGWRSTPGLPRSASASWRAMCGCRRAGTRASRSRRSKQWPAGVP